MAKSKVKCTFCNSEFEKENGSINRAKRNGKNIYCSRKCSADSKRTTKAEKVEKKRLYDIEYRNKNLDRIKKRKAEYNARTYDPVKAAIQRKKRAKQHAEYCRRPEYKAWKKEYDRRYRAKQKYGEFWECYLLSMDLDCEILTRMDRYQIMLENKTLNKTQRRHRDEQRLNSTKP